MSDRERAQTMAELMRIAASMVEVFDDIDSADEREITLTLTLPMAWTASVILFGSVEPNMPPIARGYVCEFGRRVMAAYDQQIVGL